MANSRHKIIKDVYARKFFDVNSNLSRAYYIHAIKYGDYLDVRTYHNVKITHNGKDRNNFRRCEGNKRCDSLSRARQQIYRVIHGNCFRHGKFLPVFTTYTFEEQHTEIDTANALFSMFRRRLERYIGHKLQYLCVPEIQKEREKKERKGVWHFHVVWFNLPFIDYQTHENIWGNGWSQIDLVRSIRDVGAYVAKYLSKDIYEKRLFGKPTYYTSHNLLRPQEFFEKLEVDNILASCNTKIINRYEGETFTQIKYKLI